MEKPTEKEMTYKTVWKAPSIFHHKARLRTQTNKKRLVWNKSWSFPLCRRVFLSCFDGLGLYGPTTAWSGHCFSTPLSPEIPINQLIIVYVCTFPLVLSSPVLTFFFFLLYRLIFLLSTLRITLHKQFDIQTAPTPNGLFSLMAMFTKRVTTAPWVCSSHPCIPTQPVRLCKRLENDINARSRVHRRTNGLHYVLKR